jgi:redox-sensitive bicupin YhaK (pirin superfamily)
VVGLYALRSAWAAFALYHLGIVTVIVAARETRRIRTLVRGWRSAEAIAAIALASAGGLLVWFVWPYAGVGAGFRSGLSEIGLRGGAWHAFLVYHIGVNPWLEELYWRGYLGSRARLPTLRDAAFAGYHVLDRRGNDGAETSCRGRDDGGSVITIRRAGERGHADHGWLDTCHTFSFARYYDENHMGFRSLRVLNEDRVRPGQGFGTHPHQDMEIITYPLAGAIEHRDSMGNGSVIRPGDVQRMSAGTGVTHSEFNHSKDDPLHFLQIWIVPDEMGLEPSYEQKTFPRDTKRGRLLLVGSPDGREGSVTIHQDVLLYASLLDEGAELRHRIGEGRYAWVQLARGRISLNDQQLSQGDGAALSGESGLSIQGTQRAEVLLFDLG